MVDTWSSHGRHMVVTLRISEFNFLLSVIICNKDNKRFLLSFLCVAAPFLGRLLLTLLSNYEIVLTFFNYVKFMKLNVLKTILFIVLVPSSTRHY